MGLVDRLLAGDQRALARLASLVEAGDPLGEEAIARLYPRTGAAHVVGVTGPPGAGKSTLVNALVGEIRRSGRRVGIVAVDPSSPITGGAVLGDRIRMMERHADEGVFIRSLASRGRLGGLSTATAGVVHLLDAAGYPIVLVETVGAGQDGIDIASLAQTVVVVQVPGLGDGVQAIKAGVLEVGDLLVVNKADRPGAAEVARLLRDGIAQAAGDDGWTVPVVETAAATGEGVPDLLARIDAHRAYLDRSGEWQARLRTAATAEVLGRLRRELERRLALDPAAAPEVRRGIDAVAARRRPPGPVVEELLAGFDAVPR
ncbi:MAG: methylmalonyl Co-A mutase-associated GTPase MeaB [Chloroflexota bacterium]|nr:methylmalonyl Co-A mutase-associated GTPase MeaB [Chloroflexota bacterium]